MHVLNSGLQSISLGKGYFITVADLDLQIRGEEGGGHPDSEIRGSRSQKNIFSRPFGPHFGLK